MNLFYIVITYWMNICNQYLNLYALDLTADPKL